MSNRRFEQFALSLEKKSVKLYAKVTFAESGAPTLVKTTTINGSTRQISKGIASISRTSAGLYVVSFGIPAGSLQAAQTDNYYFLMNAQSCFVDPSAAPAAPLMYVAADNSASGSVSIQFTAEDGTPTDPASGEAVLIEFTLSNSSV